MNNPYDDTPALKTVWLEGFKAAALAAAVWIDENEGSESMASLMFRDVVGEELDLAKSEKETNGDL